MQINKVLVINLMHIGDLLLVTPVLRTLRTRCPQSHIALMTDSKLADLVRLNPCIDELLLIDKKGRHNNKLRYAQFIYERIRKQRFDTVINLHRNERASFAAAFSGAKHIVGYATMGAGLFFSQVMENRKREKHQVQAHFDVLRECLGISEMDDRGIEMYLSPEAKQQAENLWRQHFSAEMPVIGLNIGASWPTKRWPQESFAELADRFVAQGYGIAFFGGSMDVALVEETRQQMKYGQDERVQIFTGGVTLMELAALLQKVTVFVTNDSGPMHIAVAMKVPIVSIFGASPVEGFYPYDKTSIILSHGAPCHPCYEHTCRLGTLECMHNITVEQVSQAVKTQQLKKN